MTASKVRREAYGTMDYEVIGFRDADLVKMDILVKGVRVDGPTIVHVQRPSVAVGHSSRS